MVNMAAVIAPNGVDDAGTTRAAPSIPPARTSLAPTRLMLHALAWIGVLAIVVSVATPVFEDAWQWWLGALGVLAALAVADALAAWSIAGGDATLTVSRRVPHTVPVGVVTEVALKLGNEGARVAVLDVFDHHPVEGESEGLPVTIAIPPGRFALLRYRFTPTERGDLRFGRVAVRVTSPMGFWKVGLAIGVAESIRSFPNYAAVTRYALLAVDHRLSQIGVLKRRRRGEGMDFHQLRDYRDGDSMRTIDWKATARRVKLISREYQDERDQQVIFLLDCSRRMNARDDALSHFDHTLNAILLMTFVAVRQGDAVGLMTFGSGHPDGERFVAPKKSPEMVSRFLNALYPLNPSLRVPDYTDAALQLGKRLNKRALVIVISNLRDEDEEGLSAALSLLKRRHLVMFANLREASVDEALNETGAGAAEVREEVLFTHAAAARYATDRDQVIARMRARGVRLIDVPPASLPIALVNQYLDLKQSGAG